MNNRLIETLREQIAMLSERSKECRDGAELASLSSAMAALVGELRALEEENADVEGMKVETMTIEECLTEMRKFGIRTSFYSLTNGIDSGDLPFAVSLPSEKQAVRIIFKKDFDQWILRHGVRVAKQDETRRGESDAGKENAA